MAVKKAGGRGLFDELFCSRSGRGDIPIIKQNKRLKRVLHQLCHAFLRQHEPDGRYDTHACNCETCQKARRYLEGDYSE